MNLVIDIGNTVAKVAVFQKSALLEKKVLKKEDLERKIDLFFSHYPAINKVIVSTVSDGGFSFDNHLEILYLDKSTKLPFQNCYQTAGTLGSDRKALVAAAAKEFPDQPVLIIDAGTCVTYDFKDRENRYFGGGISPGLMMRFRALNEFTARLPLVGPVKQPELIGRNTDESIRSGVIFGLSKEIDGLVEEYSSRHPGLAIILTGGDAQFLSVNLKNTIFANSNFLLEGLNYILEFNISK